MRVLIVSNLYPPHGLGGMELRCRETVESLSQRGHVCHVLTSRFGHPARNSREADITRALYLESNVNHYRPLDFFLRRPSHNRANHCALSHAVQTFEPDVIFIWGMWNLSTQLAYRAEQWMPGRVAYVVAGYWLMEHNSHEAYWQRCSRHAWVRALMGPLRKLALRVLQRERKAYTLALEHVACVSEYVRNKLSKAGVLPHGARVIYNGIDPDPFISAAKRRSPKDGQLNLVYTGNLVTHKGVRTAVEALGLLSERSKIDGVRLTLVGSGHPDYETLLHDLVEEMGLGDHVVFYGRVPREKIAGILAKHDIFIFTSVYEEPIARSVMEAMASGLAVIGTSVGGQREMLVDGVNALVFPPGDAARLADLILELRGNQKMMQRLAKAGRKTVSQRFTLSRMVDEMEAWLKEIVS